jgi:hypothetical protein
MGKITIKNTGTREIDQWKLEFDWDRNISNLWNAKIESKLDNHYVISFVKHNTIILPGESVTIGFIGNKGNVSQGPSNFKLTDIYDLLAANEVKDVASTVKYLKTRHDVDKNKIGIYGFSYGACKAELYAHLKSDVKVFVFDGGSATIPTYSPGVTWEIVVNDVMKTNKEVYGNDDPSIYENLDIPRNHKHIIYLLIIIKNLICCLNLNSILK